MATTTIRLPEKLKTKVTAAAARAGTTAHAFILEAIAEKAEREEQRQAFLQSAENRYSEIVDTGMTIPWTEMRACLERSLARGDGKLVNKPKARKLAR
jgi:predicted transcriptional regulator